MEKVRIGVIGLGGRGIHHACMLCEMPDAEVSAVCDVRIELAEKTVARIEELCGKRPEEYSDYMLMFKNVKLDAVVVATGWQMHIPIAIEAMKNGIPAGIEVGAASSVEECHMLLETYKQTGTWCMMLQNCNYGRNELALLNMAKQNVFGELVHLECGYEHDLRHSFAQGWERNHFRLDHNLHRNGDLYPMHGLGPMMKLLKINRGNRMVSLVSMSSKSRGVKDWAKNNLPADHHIHNKAINNGDVVNTIIKCSGGETILVTHDTALPRPYSRGGKVQGTHGIWAEANINSPSGTLSSSVHIEGKTTPHEWEDFLKFIETNDYEHPIWKEYIVGGIKSGHGGMDYLLLRAFIEDGVKKGLPPFDTYDTAVLKAISPLTEKSIALGGQPVEIPDFTNGKWLTPEPAIETKYNINI